MHSAIDHATKQRDTSNESDETGQRQRNGKTDKVLMKLRMHSVFQSNARNDRKIYRVDKRQGPANFLKTEVEQTWNLYVDQQYFPNTVTHHLRENGFPRYVNENNEIGQSPGINEGQIMRKSILSSATEEATATGPYK